jgi:hypothetical protein
MFSIKLIVATVFMAALFSGGSSPGCRSKKSDSPPSNQMSTNENASDGDLKILAEGSLSPITTTFAAVVRDSQTYASLRGTAANLPALTDNFFQSNVVIAAFLGQRNTTGYSVAISTEPNGQIRVAEKSPRKDAMVGQMITSPFKLVALPVTGKPAVNLALDETFRQAGQLYRISNGSFLISGGFAGRTETYQLAGKLQLMRLGNLITIGFAVVSSGSTRERSLRDFATGSINDDAFGAGLSHGSLVDPPSGDLRVNGRIAEKNKLLIGLDSGPATVPDGYAGKGSLEAEIVPRSSEFNRSPTP